MKKSSLGKTAIKKNDTLKIAATVETKRYSEHELAHFHKIIIGKLNEAKEDNALLKSAFSQTNDHGTNDTSPTFKIMEDGSEIEAKEEAAQLALRQQKFIENLQNALIRIKNKTYGICRVTGKLIPKERLLSVPHATLSIEAKLGQQYNQATLYLNPISLE